MTVKGFLPRRGIGPGARYNPRRAMIRPLLLGLAILSPRALAAQQPFVTDDAAVTARGIRTRGLVWTGGVSLTRAFTQRLNLGVELSGAASRHAELGQEALQALAGGNWMLREDRSLDFALLAGRHAAAPRYGVLVGFSADL